MTDLLDVKLSNFEGPLDLLLHLIYKNELDLYDIPIALIADQFVDAIKGIDEIDIEVAAEFIQMASYLIYLKSKMLLPQQIAIEDGIDPEEEKFLFTQRLVEYSFYRDMALLLREKEFFSQRYLIRKSEIHLPVENLGGDIYKLANSFFSLMVKEEEVVVPITKEHVDIDIVVKQLLNHFRNEKEMLWGQLKAMCSSRKEMVVYFLAILELAKQKLVDIFQAENFDDFMVHYNG
ncbi:MAG: segregation/condensation protein A [Calditerrivibrio sp.]|nr:segregation/condensation protein A [Calditerrivibrio sp.]